MFIALYNMADRSMQGWTVLNIIEIASFIRLLQTHSLNIAFQHKNESIICKARTAKEFAVDPDSEQQLKRLSTQQDQSWRTSVMRYGSQ